MKFIAHALGLAALLAGSQAGAADNWNDVAVGYRYEPAAREPRNGSEIAKNILQFTYAGGYRYGNQFLNVDHFLSDRHDRARHASEGAEETYLTYRHQLEAGKLTGTPVAVGPLRDLAFTLGADFNQKDSPVGPRKRLLLAGPTLKFDVPGFLDLGLWISREQNHNSLGTAHRDLTFDSAWMLGAAWGIPLPLGSATGRFQGFLNIIGPKGRDYNGRPTAREILLRTALLADAGQPLGLGRNVLWVGVGYEYWDNKFGNLPAVGTRVSSPQLQAEWHF